MIMTPSISESNCMFNIYVRIGIGIWEKYRLFRVNPGRYSSFSARKFNFIFSFYYFFRHRRKVVEFWGLVPTQVSSIFPAASRGFFVGIFSGLHLL